MGDAALRNLERAWRGGDPLARQHLAEGYLRRGDARAVLDVFAEAPPSTSGEAELHARALGQVLARFQPLQRIDGLRAYGQLVGWCGPGARYGALWNRARHELRVLDRQRGVLLADGLPLRGVARAVVHEGDLHVEYALGLRAWGRWNVEPGTSPDAVSHVPFAARWERVEIPSFSAFCVPGGSLSPEGLGALLEGSKLKVLDGFEPFGTYDLAASWRRVDPVAAASRGWATAECGFLEGRVLLAGPALVDLTADRVSFARGRIEFGGLVPRWDRAHHALLGLVDGKLRRTDLSSPTPLIRTPSDTGLDQSIVFPVPASARGWWHPEGDVAAVTEPHGSWVGLPEQRPSLRLPLGTAPLGWTPSGELLVARGGGDAVALELWGAP